MQKGRNFGLRVSTSHSAELLEYLRTLQNVNYVATATRDEVVELHVQCRTPSKLSIARIPTASFITAGDPRCHVEELRSLANFSEFGTFRKRGGLSIAEVFEKSDSELLTLPWQMHSIVARTIDSRRKMFRTSEILVRKNVEVMYIWGKSGAGKTTRARQLIHERHAEFGEYYNIVRFANGFWHGVSSSCNVALYDEFRDSDLPASEFIRFVDYNVSLLNVKGGTEFNNYKFIVITTIQNPNDIYMGQPAEFKEQWLRRISTLYIS